MDGTDWSMIVSGKELETAAKERKQTVERKSKVLPGDAAILEKDGWHIVKTEQSGKCTLEKEKPVNVQFENEVWLVFYRMGFSHMNSTNKFSINLNGNSKQIDVIAFDEETCVLVECKAAKTLDKTASFKQELESIHGYYADVCAEVVKQYGNRRFKQIFATKNYLIPDDSNDSQRMKSFGFYYVNQDAVSYYSSLAEHLGAAARYQLLGNLFSGEEITGIDNTVPAIKGVMGGHEYYSFLIEPERLLKFSYVLHRNNANHLMMPTYQRLIKKDRLNSIRKFLNTQDGFFPNSIIVSIDNNGDEIRFDETDGFENQLATPGVLHLPRKYRTIYVIDGQHRLYGYSDSDKCSCNTVSVVAFVNLPPEDQVKMFMDINENQKKVSKTLRNTLIIDLQWKSPNRKKAKEALMLRLAEWLGEDSDSALYGRILTGEDKETDLRCITTEYIRDALSRSSFFNEYGASGVRRHGTLDKDDNDSTLAFIKPLLIRYFNEISSLCCEEWSLGGKGCLSINNTVFALIKILDDIVNIKLAGSGESIVCDSDSFYSRCEDFILDLCDVIGELGTEENAALKEKGQGGRVKAWHTLQVALNRRNAEFTNEQIQNYIADNCTDNNPECERFVSDIETELRTRFRGCLEASGNWREMVPDKLGSDLASRVGSENFRRKKSGLDELKIWDLISFEEIFKISTFSNNWSLFAQQLLHRNSLAGGQGKASLTWLKNLSVIKAKLDQEKSITRIEFGELQTIHKDFCGGD